MYNKDEIDYDTYVSLCSKKCETVRIYFIPKTYKTSERQTNN